MSGPLHAVPGPGVTPGALRMSMAEIAALAGVKRPVVTTWRRRHRDFPAPVGGGAQGLLFDAREVADWLSTTGRDPDGRVKTDLSLHTLAGLGGELPANELLALTTALICLRALDDEPLADDDLPGLSRRAAVADPDDRFLRSEIGLLSAGTAWLAAAVDDLIEAAWECKDAFERIMGARTHFQAGDLYARTLSPALARLIAELSGARERARERAVTIGDPAAGPGDLLTAVAEAVGPDYQPVFLAAEADPYLARLAARRLAAHGVHEDEARVATREDLPEEWGTPDVVVTQIPYVSGERRTPEQVIARLDDIALGLAPGCTAVVLGPADVMVGALRPYSQAERDRAKLLSSGMVEAIVRLPGGLVPFRPGYETAVWVLTSAYDSPWRGWVLLADVSDRDLTGDVIDALAEDVITWRRDGYRPHAHTRTFGVQVSVTSLTDPPRPLIAPKPRPAGNSRTAGASLVSRAVELEAALDDAAASAATERQPMRSGIAARRGMPPATTTVGALLNARRLILRPGARIRDVQADGDGHHNVIGLPELLGRAHRGERTIDRVALAGQPRTQLTEPGDVIVTTMPELAVMVDHDGMAVVEFPAKVLRIPEAERASFTPRTLAALLAGKLPSLRPAGTVRPVWRLDEQEVPLLSPLEVAFLDRFLADLDARRAAAQRELDLLRELQDLTTAGLGDGTLTFSQTPSTPSGQ